MGRAPGAGHGRSRFVMCVCLGKLHSASPLSTYYFDREGDQCKLKLSAVALGNVALARSLVVSLTLCECRAGEGWL